MEWVIINSPTKVVILGYTKFSDTQVCLLETSGRNRLVTLFFFSTKHILCFMSWTNHEAIRIGITFQRVGPIPPNHAQAHGCFRQDFTQRIIMTVWQYDNSDQFDTDLCLERCKKCVCVCDLCLERCKRWCIGIYTYIYIYECIYIYIHTYKCTHAQTLATCTCYFGICFFFF